MVQERQKGGTGFYDEDSLGTSGAAIYEDAREAEEDARLAARALHHRQVYAEFFEPLSPKEEERQRQEAFLHRRQVCQEAFEAPPSADELKRHQRKQLVKRCVAQGKSVPDDDQTAKEVTREELFAYMSGRGPEPEAWKKEREVRMSARRDLVEWIREASAEEQDVCEEPRQPHLIDIMYPEGHFYRYTGYLSTEQQQDDTLVAAFVWPRKNKNQRHSPIRSLFSHDWPARDRLSAQTLHPLENLILAHFPDHIPERIFLDFILPGMHAYLKNNHVLPDDAAKRLLEKMKDVYETSYACPETSKRSHKRESRKASRTLPYHPSVVRSLVDDRRKEWLCAWQAHFTDRKQPQMKMREAYLHTKLACILLDFVYEFPGVRYQGDDVSQVTERMLQRWIVRTYQKRSPHPVKGRASEKDVKPLSHLILGSMPDVMPKKVFSRIICRTLYHGLPQSRVMSVEDTGKLLALLVTGATSMYEDRHSYYVVRPGCREEHRRLYHEHQRLRVATATSGRDRETFSQELRRHLYIANMAVCWADMLTWESGAYDPQLLVAPLTKALAHRVPPKAAPERCHDPPYRRSDTPNYTRRTTLSTSRRR